MFDYGDSLGGDLTWRSSGLVEYNTWVIDEEGNKKMKARARLLG